MTLMAVDRDARWIVFSEVVTLHTEVARQFVDLTELLAERVRRSGVREGLASVQSRHTTTAVVVNEYEPYLAGDFDRLLDRLVPADVRYGHDDFSRRPKPSPDERENGAAHCRSLMLGQAHTLHVAGGELAIGRWQRVLFAEFDGPQPRSVSIVVMGIGTHA